MNEKIMIKKNKQIQDIPISPKNLNGMIVYSSNIIRPNNPEPRTKSKIVF